MEFSDSAQILKKPRQRLSNVYVPPPARKSSGQDVGSVERTVTARPSVFDETKACNDSSLLFVNDKGRTYSLQKNHKKKQKSRHQQLNKNSDKESDEKLRMECKSLPEYQNSCCNFNEPNNFVKEELVAQAEENDRTLLENEGIVHSTHSSSCCSDDDIYEGNISSSPIPETQDSTEYIEDKNVKSGFETFADELMLELVELEGNPKAVEPVCQEKTYDVVEPQQVVVINSKRVEVTHASEKQPCVGDASITLNKDENDWETLYDESGECYLASDHLHVPDKQQDKKKVLRSPESGSEKEDFENRGSIVEVYGFSQEMRTNDIMTVLSAYTTRGLKLSWVDDTHALAIFPTPNLADEILSCDLPMIRTRPLSQATAASQEKARHLVLPSTLRPKTCPAMARRLVSGALGLRMSVTPEARAAEIELLRKAREEKKLAAKQRDAAWEGIFRKDE